MLRIAPVEMTERVMLRIAPVEMTWGCCASPSASLGAKGYFRSK
jgi:hypothetical protein